MKVSSSPLQVEGGHSTSFATCFPPPMRFACDRHSAVLSVESSETGKVLLPMGAAEAFYYSNTPPHGSSGIGDDSSRLTDLGAGARDKEEQGFLPRDRSAPSTMATPPSSPEATQGARRASRSQTETGTRKKGFVCDCSPWRGNRPRGKRQSREQGEAFAKVKLQRGTALQGSTKP